jgi:hypothetical protein
MYKWKESGKSYSLFVNVTLNCWMAGVGSHYEFRGKLTFPASLATKALTDDGSSRFISYSSNSSPSHTIAKSKDGKLRGIGFGCRVDL